MALGSTQPLVKMSTRNVPGGKGGRGVRLTTVVMKSGSLNFVEPSGPAQACYGRALALPFTLVDFGPSMVLLVVTLIFF